MDRQDGVVRLDDGGRDFWRGHDRERAHHAIGKLLTDLGDQQRAHTRARAAAQRVTQLLHNNNRVSIYRQLWF
jgi:hypothetical protein